MTTPLQLIDSMHAPINKHKNNDHTFVLFLAREVSNTKDTISTALGSAQFEVPGFLCCYILGEISTSYIIYKKCVCICI